MDWRFRRGRAARPAPRPGETPMSEMRTHGIREFQRNRDAYDLCVEEIKSIGYTVIDSGYTPQQLETLRSKIDAIYEQQVREIGGAENLSMMHDADLARALLA